MASIANSADHACTDFQPSDLLFAALNYAERGWYVIPLHTVPDCVCSCGKKECGRNAGKHPRTAHGLKDASRDPRQIYEWWEKWPDANVGIRTGVESGFFALDVDGENGQKSLREMEKKYGPLPDTWTVRTGGSGLQLYFLYPAGQKLRNSQGKDRTGNGHSRRGEGGYVSRSAEPASQRPAL